MESDSEDEIFFGPVSTKEEVIAAPLRNRKTEIYIPGMTYLYRRSSVPLLASLEEEEIKACNTDAESSQTTPACEDQGPIELIGEKLVNSYQLSLNEIENKSCMQESIESCITAQKTTYTDLSVSSDHVIAADLKHLSLDVQEKDSLTCVHELPAIKGNGVVPSKENVILENMILKDSPTCIADLEVHFPDSSVLQSVCSSSGTGNEAGQFALGDDASQKLENDLEGNIMSLLECQEDYDSASLSQGLYTIKDTEAKDLGKQSLLKNHIVTTDTSYSCGALEEVDIVKAAMEVLYLDNRDDDNLKYVIEHPACDADDMPSEPFCMLDTIKGYAEENGLETLTSHNVSTTSVVNSDFFPSGSLSSCDSSSIEAVSTNILPSSNLLLSCDLSTVATDNTDILPSSLMSSCSVSTTVTTNRDLLLSNSFSVQDSIETGNKALDISASQSEIPDRDSHACITGKEGKDTDRTTLNPVYLHKDVDTDLHVDCPLRKSEISTARRDSKSDSESMETSYPLSSREDLGSVCTETESDSLLTSDFGDSSLINKVEEQTSINVGNSELEKGFTQTSSGVCSQENLEKVLIEAESDSLLVDGLEDSVMGELVLESSGKKEESMLEDSLQGEISRSSKIVPSSNASSYFQSDQNACDQSRQSNSSTESYGIGNKGLILSQTPNLDSCSVSSTSLDRSYSKAQSNNSFPPIDSLNCLESLPASCVEGHSMGHCLEQQQFEAADEDQEVETSNGSIHHNTPVKSSNFSQMGKDDESGSESSSPTRKFNDTIEEMEMLLKYGLNYGEKPPEEDICDSSPTTSNFTRKCFNNDNDDSDKNDESIISPRKSSVLSSVSNFNPEWNSTQVPIGQEQSYNRDTGQAIIREEYKGDLNRWLNSPSKSVPPPKPPRSVNLGNGSPAKSLLKSSTPKGSIASPKTLQVQKAKRNDLPLPKVGIGKVNPSSPRSTTINQMKPNNSPKPEMRKIIKTPVTTPRHDSRRLVKTPGVATPKSDIKRLKKAPNTVSGAVRSVSLTSSMRNKPLQMSTPTSAHTASRFKGQNVVSSRPLTPLAQQKRTVIIEKHSSTPSLPPRPTPSSNSLKFTKKEKVPILRKHLRQGGLDIISPVAQYLRENPPPALVVNVKPRHKLQEEVEKASHKPCDQPPAKASTRVVASKTKQSSSRTTPVLPVAIYSSAVPVIMDDAENKENERLRQKQEINARTLPSYVIKHKGRVKLPKDSVKEMSENVLASGHNKSPSGFKVSAMSPRQTTSLRSSLMEVSLYESHKTHYSNTLK